MTPPNPQDPPATPDLAALSRAVTAELDQPASAEALESVRTKLVGLQGTWSDLAVARRTDLDRLELGRLRAERECGEKYRAVLRTRSRGGLHALDTDRLKARIVDNAGLALAGVPVRVIDPRSAKEWTTTTDASGYFRVPEAEGDRPFEFEVIDRGTRIPFRPDAGEREAGTGAVRFSLERASDAEDTTRAERLLGDVKVESDGLDARMEEIGLRERILGDVPGAPVDDAGGDAGGADRQGRAGRNRPSLLRRLWGPVPEDTMRGDGGDPA